VRSIWRRLGERAAPGGDDCAFVEIGSVRLAVSSDLFIEGTHFQAGWLTPGEIGWRAATAALSDLAAVAADPQGVLTSLGASPETPEDQIAEVLGGVGDAAAAVGAKVWGGDLVRSPRWVLDVMVVGGLEGEPLRRSGAKAGDSLLVTGTLGGPSAALEAWRSAREPDRMARERFARPSARVNEALWLRGRGASAVIDISDGLVADAGHLSAASGVTCVLELERIPIHAAVTGGPEAAATSGEEYELLVAVPAQDQGAVCSVFEGEFGLLLTEVGRVEAGTGVRVERAGKVVPDLAQFEHF
jgi:thiamine-monophosphate kinase